MFGNPVAQAFIRPPNSPVIIGDFRVTAPFGGIDADHKTPHIGVDIGNGLTGEPILAMADGKVAFSDLLGDPKSPYGLAKVVRIDHPQFTDHVWQTGYAHLATMTVKRGQSVHRGDKIGTLGSTGANSAHLHIGCKRDGVEVDVWPLLDQQNQETDLDPSFSPKPNRTVTVTKGARHRLAPTTADPANIAIASDPGGPLGFPLLGTVIGQAVNGNTIWYAYWRPETKKVYYLHSGTTGPEIPFEATAGHSDAELADARAAAAADAATAVSAAAATKAAQFGTKKV